MGKAHTYQLIINDIFYIGQAQSEPSSSLLRKTYGENEKPED
jgi:hypothetical protein